MTRPKGHKKSCRCAVCKNIGRKRKTTSRRKRTTRRRSRR